MGTLSNFGLSLLNSFNAWRREYPDPAQVQGGKTLTRPQWYNLLWSYYTNSAFEHMPLQGNYWSGYKQAYRLYRNMRSIYNPTSRLVDFYAGIIYPGVLTTDGKDLDDSTPIAIPFPDGTDPQLLNAIAQVWRWSNWQAGKGTMVRYAAATGNVLVEVKDDLERGEVFFDIVWPGLVKDLDLSPSGVVRSYALEYSATDDDGFGYIYRKEVDENEFRFYKNGLPWSYNGDPASYANPYGFVPAAWIKHRDLAGNWGAPAISGSIPKVDELNSLASHIHDHIHRVVGSPTIFWAKGDVNAISRIGKRAASDELADPEADRDSILMLKGPEGGRADSLIAELNIPGAMDGLDRLIAEIEHDHPELAMYQQLREMSTVTGPAADRLLGDVKQMVMEAAANYDLGSVRLFQMAVAMGGYRVNNGDWDGTADKAGGLTKHQQAFKPFNLDSYGEGALDLAIMPRPLVPLTQKEQLELQQMEISVQQATVQVSLMEKENIE